MRVSDIEMITIQTANERKYKESSEGIAAMQCPDIECNSIRLFPLESRVYIHIM
jgi:hypothetical protein